MGGKGKGKPKGKGKGKPKGKGKGKPKGKGKKPKKTVLSRISGTWTFRYPGMTFKFVISHGHITINKLPIRLVPSNNKKFPTSAGWLMFTYRTWVYYIRISITGIKVVAFHGGKMVLGMVTGKVKKPSKGKGKPKGKGKKPKGKGKGKPKGKGKGKPKGKGKGKP